MTTTKATEKKATNWTDAQVKGLQEGYKGNNSTEALEALCAGKTAAAVRAKLVSLGIYKKADEVKKVGGATSEKKIEIVHAIEIFAGLPKNSLETLEKSSKPQLELLARRLTELSDQYNATIPADADPAVATVDVDGYQTNDIAEAAETNGM